MWGDSPIIPLLPSSFSEQRCTWNAGIWYLPGRGNREIFVRSLIYPNSSQSTKWQTGPSLRASERNCCLHKRHMKMSWLLKGNLSKRREWNKSLGKMSKSHWIVGNEAQHLCPSWAVTSQEQQVPSFGCTARHHRWWLLRRENQDMLKTSARALRGNGRVLRSWGEDGLEFC